MQRFADEMPKQVRHDIKKLITKTVTNKNNI